MLFRSGQTGSAALPFTEGVLDGTVSGLARLVDAVAAAGFVAEGDLMPLRAGIAMVFDAGPGPDALTTHVEARPDGSLYVNGARMQ